MSAAEEALERMRAAIVRTAVVPGITVDETVVNRDVALIRAAMDGVPDRTPRMVVLHTRQGVNMGDHAESITSAVAVKPDETVQALADRLLLTRQWLPESGMGDAPDRDAFLVIRLEVQP